MVLDEPNQDDTIIEQDGIRFIYDHTVEKYAENILIVCKDSYYGKKLVVTKVN